MANSQAMQSVVQILKTAPQPLAVIVSALAGVTDSLSEVCRLAAKHDSAYLTRLQSVEDQHMAVARDLACTENGFPALFAALRDVLRAVFVTSCISVDQLNFVMGHGELISAQLIAHAYGPDAQYVDARDFIVIKNSEDRLPKIKWKRSQHLWDSLPRSHPVLFITGFICRTVDGRMATLKRNGSDLSAAVVAKLAKAEELVIWKEVDGVFTADPRIVPGAHLLRDMSFQELAELSYFGAKVIYPQAMLPAISANIPIVLRNTFNPSDPGTHITAQSSTSGLYAKAITVIKGIALVNVEGCGMMGVPGVAKRVFEACSQSDINVMLISQASSEHSICLAIQGDQAEVACKALKEAFYRELKRHQIEEVETVTGLSIVAVVGDGMKRKKGAAATFFRALSDADVNVIAIAQGSSERNISVVIQESDISRALNSAHSALFPSEQ